MDCAAGLDGDLSFLAPPGEPADWRLALAYEAAADAGVLDALPGTVAEIAARCDLHEGALRAVLGQLAVWEVVVADREGRYRDGPAAPSWPADAMLIVHAGGDPPVGHPARAPAASRTGGAAARARSSPC